MTDESTYIKSMNEYDWSECPNMVMSSQQCTWLENASGFQHSFPPLLLRSRSDAKFHNNCLHPLQSMPGGIDHQHFHAEVLVCV